MFSIQRLSLFLALVFCLMQTLKTLSFCDSFAANDYKISYGFRRITESDPYLSYLFINQSYWRLEYSDNNDDKQKNVRLLEDDGKQSNWFGNQYSMAICVWLRYRCVVGLFSLDYKTIYWGELNETLDELTLDEENGTTVKSFPSKLKNIRTAFVPNWGQFIYSMVAVVRQKSSIDYEFYEINPDLEVISVPNLQDLIESSVSDTVPKVLKELISGLEVIAVLAQYSVKDYNLNGLSGEGMVILFQFDRSIKYCYTNVEKKSYSCDRQLSTLIDCSKTVVKNNDFVVPDEETVDLRGISVVVLNIIGFTLIIVFCWVYRTNRRNWQKKKEKKKMAAIRQE